METFLLWFVGSLVGAFGGSYLASYLKKKGENLATHEDIQKLVEQVKATTEATKAIEARIDNQVWKGQREWEMKRDAAVAALEAYQRFRYACGRFIIAEDKYNKGEAKSIEDRVSAAVEWRQMFNKFSDTLNVLLFIGGPVTRTHVVSLFKLLLRLNETDALELGKELSLTSMDVVDGFENIRHSLRIELGLVDTLDLQEMVEQKMNAATRLIE
jgi:hypothetical protein